MSQPDLKNNTDAPRLSRPLRAKDMAAFYNANPTNTTMAEIVVELLEETSDMAKSRGIKTDSALFALFREQDNKWHACARRCPGVLPSLFQVATRKIFTELAEEFWPLPKSSEP